MFPQWFELLKSIFESFLLLLQRIQVSLRPQAGLRLLPASFRPSPTCPVFQATLSTIRDVVVGVQLAGQKQVLEEAGPACQTREAAQGQAELAYLTHEGLFISDALNQLQQQAQDHNQKPTAASRAPQNQPEASGEDSAPQAADTPTFTYVCGGASSAAPSADASEC